MVHPEKIEKYFTTQNEYWNKQAAAFFKRANESKLFADLEIPLHFFSTYESIFYNHRDKPLQVLRQFIGEMKKAKLNNEQQIFIIKYLAKYFKETVYTDEKLGAPFEAPKEIDMGTVVTILETELSKLKPVQVQKSDDFDFEKDKEEANKIEDFQQRLLFLEKRLKEYKQHHADGWAVDLIRTDKKYEIEIQFVKKLIKMQPEQKQNLTANPTEPIWWKRSNRLLKYLMDELARLDLIDRDSPVNKLIKQHFIDKDKKPFTDSIAQNSSGTGSNKGTLKNTASKPKGHADIDNIIGNLKKQKE